MDLGTGATELAKQLMSGEFGKGKSALPIPVPHPPRSHPVPAVFTPFFIESNEIRILGAAAVVRHLARGDLQNQLAPHYSPLHGLENLAAGMMRETITPGTTVTAWLRDRDRRGSARVGEATS